MSKPMSEREIAKALKISRARVRYHLKMAMKKIAGSESLRVAIDVVRDAEHRKSVQHNLAKYDITHKGGRKFRSTPCP